MELEPNIWYYEKLGSGFEYEFILQKDQISSSNYSDQISKFLTFLNWISDKNSNNSIFEFLSSRPINIKLLLFYIEVKNLYLIIKN